MPAAPGKRGQQPAAAPLALAWHVGLAAQRSARRNVAHILNARGATLDWQRLLRRFGPHWRVLLSCLVLQGFIYPDARGTIPNWVLDELISRLGAETAQPAHTAEVCQGTLLSRSQYLPDTQAWGYRDARLAPLGPMSAGDIALWTTST